MKRLILMLCLCLGGCVAGPVSTGPDCDAIDREIAALDQCAPDEGVAEKWSDIRADACDGAADCRDIMPAIEYLSSDCPTAAASMLSTVCN